MALARQDLKYLIDQRTINIKVDAIIPWIRKLH